MATNMIASSTTGVLRTWGPQPMCFWYNVELWQVLQGVRHKLIHGTSELQAEVRRKLIQGTSVLQAEEAKEAAMPAFEEIHRLMTRLQPEVCPFAHLHIGTHLGEDEGGQSVVCFATFVFLKSRYTSQRPRSQWLIWALVFPVFVGVYVYTVHIESHTFDLRRQAK